MRFRGFAHPGESQGQDVFGWNFCKKDRGILEVFQGPKVFIRDEVAPYSGVLEDDGHGGETPSYVMRWRTGDDRDVGVFVRSDEASQLRMLWEVSNWGLKGRTG